METQEQTITITIDGKTVECRPGELLIAAAERSGIFVPRFCWHPRMDPVGACRMCLVHIEGSPPIPGRPGVPKPQTACTTPVREGMVVETQFSNDQIRGAQKGMLELLLINHPLDCPICDRGGECPLQDQTLDYGPSESRFVEQKRRFVKPVDLSPLVKLDRERCILCYRCTRFCEELSGDAFISAMQRGPQAFIYAFEDDSFDSYFSGNTVQICPVGALTSSPYRFQARPWDIHMQPTTCNLCAAGCAITADVRVADGKLVRVSARVNEETNEEWLCDKGRYGHAYVSSPERLRQPFVRRDDELVAAGWDEAFRVIAERLERIEGSSGVVVGGSLPDEDAYVAQKFARLVLQTNNVDHRLEAGMDVSALIPPQLGYADLLGADLVVVVGADLREELPVVFLRLRIAASKRGVRVAVVHPRAVALTEMAAEHVASLPGTEGAVGAGVAAVLGKPVAAGAQAMAGAAGVPLAAVENLARLLEAAQRPVVLLGPRTTAPDTVRAWQAAAEVSGARLGWAPRRAGEYGALAVGAHPGLLPGWRRVDDAPQRAEIDSAWGASVPEQPGLDVGGMLGQAREGRLDLLWLVGADVLADVPDVALVAEGLSGAGFVVVQDVQRSAQARFADVVLPAAAFVEREGTLTDWEGRRQPVALAVDPPGSARADYAILAEVARRSGRAIGCRRIGDVRDELEPLLRTGLPVATTGGVHVEARPAPGDMPLHLLTYRLLYDDGSRARHTTEITSLTPDAFVEMHPDDAKSAGVSHGDGVRVSSHFGSIEVDCRVSESVRPGVAFVPYQQPGASAQGLLSWSDPRPMVKVERR